MSQEVRTGPENPGSYAHRVWVAVLIVAAVAGGALLLWLAVKVVLLLFASVLLGLFLRSVADWAGRLAHLGPRWSFALTVAGLLLVCGGAGWALAGPVSKQINQLSGEMPQALQRLEKKVERHSWGRALMGKLHDPGGLLGQTGNLLKRIGAIGTLSLEGLIDILVILFCGFYLAAQPQLYVRGFLRLVPCGRRERARSVLGQMGGELRRWLFGQIISMSLIGILTWLGLLLLGIPASELLGLLAGILDFVPVAGPWVAGVISCAVALLKSPFSGLWVAGLFVSLHLLESHVIIPLVQRKAARLPPVLTILAMVLFYTLFGWFGLLLAIPLLAFTLIAIRTLYVEDVVEQ